MYPVLIVDDEPLVRVSLRSAVPWQRYGFHCAHEASDGEEALKLLAAHPETALVLLDLAMPRMDGLELLRRLRQRGPLPEVIVLTAHQEFGMVREAFQLGARDYLLKSELEPQALGPLLAAAAGRIARSGGRPSTAVQAAALKQELLQELLRAEDPGGLRGDFREAAAARGLRIRELLRLGLLAVRDFDAVAARCEAEGLASFSPTLTAIVEQVLERRSAGEIMRLSDEEYLLFLFFDRGHAASRLEQSSSLLCEEIRRSLSDYLDVRVQIELSAFTELGRRTAAAGERPAGGPGWAPGPAPLYRALCAGRSRPSRPVEQALQYIRANYRDFALSLREMAQEVGVTPNHLSGLFSRETGKSFREYLAFMRVEAAKRLLLDSRLKVYEVGEKVGFLSIEHFSRVFKRLTGVPPHQWARRGEP
jgi:two-component system response regulator YesN